MGAMITGNDDDEIAAQAEGRDPVPAAGGS